MCEGDWPGRPRLPLWGLLTEAAGRPPRGRMLSGRHRRDGQAARPTAASHAAPPGGPQHGWQRRTGLATGPTDGRVPRVAGAGETPAPPSSPGADPGDGRNGARQDCRAEVGGGDPEGRRRPHPAATAARQDCRASCRARAHHGSGTSTHRPCPAQPHVCESALGSARPTRKTGLATGPTAEATSPPPLGRMLGYRGRPPRMRPLLADHSREPSLGSLRQAQGRLRAGRETGRGLRFRTVGADAHAGHHNAVVPAPHPHLAPV